MMYHLYCSSTVGTRNSTTLPAGKRASLIPQRCNSLQSNLVSSKSDRGCLDAARRLSRQKANGDVGRLSAYIRDGDERTTDNSAAEIRVNVTEHRRLGDGVKAGQRRHLFVRDPGCIHGQQGKEDCGTWRKNRRVL